MGDIDKAAIRERMALSWGYLRCLMFDDAALDATKTIVTEDVPELVAAIAERDTTIVRQSGELVSRTEARDRVMRDFNALAAKRDAEIVRLTIRVERIAEAHVKHVDSHGGTWGECAECGEQWPCPTYAWATSDRDPLACWDPADDEPEPAAAAVVVDGQTGDGTDAGTEGS